MGKDKIVEIDPSAGFCFGVENAIQIAEQNLKKGDEVYGLGHMVHNEEEIGRLDQLGMKTISVSDFPDLTSGKVIFRAHGEPPSTYALARTHQIRIIDATCPIVAGLQKKISKRYRGLDREKEQIVLFGKVGHPETVGLMGQTNGEAILITDPDEISEIDPEKTIYLYSQTTMDPNQFGKLEENISILTRVSEKTNLVANCSICGQMKKRKPELKKFASRHDIVIFVSGKKSSNGAMLFNFCKQQNKNTFWIHSVKDIDPEWVIKKGSIGVSGATSTPAWQLQQVKEYLESLVKD
jgi:4-hydroxy-3-methylbut-2-enyl diphosphate reductase